MDKKTLAELFNVSPLEEIGNCLAAAISSQKHYFPPEMPPLPPEPAIEDLWRADWETLGLDMLKAMEKVGGNVHL